MSKPITVATYEGWSIRDWNPGDMYADIYCPHGHAVETINAASVGPSFTPRAALADWVEESRGWLADYCFH